jgi:hypothetical protein
MRWVWIRKEVKVVVEATTHVIVLERVASYCELGQGRSREEGGEMHRQDDLKANVG